MRRIFFGIVTIVSLTIIIGSPFISGASGGEPKVQQQSAMSTTKISDIKQGKQMAAARCISCHRFYFPREYSPTQWGMILERKKNRLSLTNAQIEKLFLYFKRDAK